MPDVQCEFYLRQVLRYIYWNPVKALMMGEKSLDYLDSARTLRLFGESGEIGRVALQRFVSEGNLQSLEAFYENKRLPFILSAEAVV